MEEPLILDRYRPLAHLGSGGHGSVVLAFDTKMARRVAIKRLPLPRTASGGLVPRTGLAEARTAALLNHPSIVTVHEWDTDSDEAFIVMEDLDGASLADVLDETGEPLTPEEVAAVLTAVASAVGFAHDNGVLHLDLKPGNVLVSREGRIKVADFGVSALTDASGQATGTAGTIGYMPPEQIRAERLDERTDCWALAALTFELLTNANPFDADSAEGSLFKIEVADMPAPSEFVTGLPEAIDDVVLAALAPEADERYDSPRAFAAALLPYLGDAEAGRESLGELVSELHGDLPAEEAYYGLGLWDRLAPHARTIVRGSAALGVAWLAWAGMTAFGVPGSVRATVASMVALAGVLAPGLGLALGLAALAAGIWRAAGWLPFALFALPAAAFWWFRGRRGGGDVLAPLAGPLLGILRAAPAMPLLLGFSLEPVAAAISSAAAALATVAASVASRGTLPAGVRISFALDPLGALPPGPPSARVLAAVALITASWALAAAACSLLARRATRGAAAVGAALGALMLGAGYGLAGRVSGSFSGVSTLLDLMFGLIVVAVVIGLGAPLRAEEE